MRSISPVNPAAISTMISSISGAASNTRIVCSITGRPAIFTSCLGICSPTRSPTPPARITAMLRLRCIRSP
jgi:hypothetical protein